MAFRNISTTKKLFELDVFEKKIYCALSVIIIINILGVTDIVSISLYTIKMYIKIQLQKICYIM